MRIIAGKYGSRKLITLEGLATRPTLDQTKEAIFSSLGGYINDFVILDVFGGSGALSLESISRGAKEACTNHQTDCRELRCRPRITRISWRLQKDFRAFE